jgi:ATP-dependent DNA helicase RecG
MSCKLGLNDRQVKAVLILKEKRKITNKAYQEIFAVARATATRDLAELVDKGIIKSSETKGAGSYYEL